MANEAAASWIGGDWRSDGVGAADSLNPADSSLLGRFSSADTAIAEAAVDAARQAFANSDWRHQPRQRAAVLLDYAARLENAAPELARTLTEENGKLIGEARGEIAAGISELRYYAGLARHIFGRQTEIEPGLFSTLTREPLGVAAIVVPWNAPMVLLMRSLAPALAAGCTAVVKTAPQTALFSERLFRLLADVEELPAGVVNAFTEVGDDAARALVASPGVDVISYTGSTETGRAIMAGAAATLKRVNLELGGSAPCIVFDDADVPAAANALARAGTAMAGQHCCSATRVLVQAGRLDETRAALAAALGDIRLGPGIEPASQMGPMIDGQSRDRLLGLLERARATDEILCGGKAAGGELQRGFFVEPTLVHAPDRRSAIYDGEVFGPVLVLDSFDDEDEAVASANDTIYGLAASIWSADLRKSQRVANRLESGTVWINSHLRTFAEIENGGYKQSGIGRLHGSEGLDEFLQTKHISWSTRF